MSPTSTHKYLITVGKFLRHELVDGVQTLVTRKPGDLIDLTLEQAQAKQDSVRLATPEDVAAYEARLRGDNAAPPIPVEHVSTAGAPPAPTPAHDPMQPPAAPGEPVARHFPAPAAGPAAVAPAAPAAQHVAAPAPAAAVPAPAAPAASPAAAPAPAPNPAHASARAEHEGKPRQRTGDKAGSKKAGGRGKGRK